MEEKQSALPEENVIESKFPKTRYKLMSKIGMPCRITIFINEYRFIKEHALFGTSPKYDQAWYALENQYEFDLATKTVGEVNLQSWDKEGQEVLLYAHSGIHEPLDKKEFIDRCIEESRLVYEPRPLSDKDYQELFPNYEISTNQETWCMQFEAQSLFEPIGTEDVDSDKAFYEMVQMNERWLQDHTDEVIKMSQLYSKGLNPEQ